MSNTTADLLLDVDGVLNPIPFSRDRSPDWEFSPSFKSSKASGRYTLNLSREMGREIESLRAQIHWLTSWGRHAHFNIGMHFDWIDHPVLAEKPESCGMYGGTMPENRRWKPQAVFNFLRNPGGKVVWIDDEVDLFIADFIELGVDIDPHGRLLTICPECDVGLTREHIASIKEFIK